MINSITIKDIAKAAGVSETTISRYLNKKYEYMSEKTRKKIEKVIFDLDYRPSNVARSLKSQKSRLIGAVIADIANPFSPVIIKGLSDKCEELGYTLMIAISDESCKNEQEHIEKFIDNQVEGLIINTSGNNEEYLERLNKTELPIVLLDRGISTANIDTVSTDNYRSGREAMAFLIAKGYQSIGFFVNAITNTVREERVRAYCDVMNENHEITGDVYVVEPREPKKIQEALEALMKLPAPRVIFTANGLTALSILEVMKQMNYEINQEFGIICFDDLTWAKVVTPTITTIAQSSYSLGAAACLQVIEKIEKGNNAKPTSLTLFPGELIIRESTDIK